MLAADPIEAVTTAVVLAGLASLISLRIENICVRVSGLPSQSDTSRVTYVLVTGVSKDNDRKARQHRQRPSPRCPSNWTSLGHCISRSKVVHNQHDQICDRSKRDDGSISQAVQLSQEGQGYHDQPFEISVSCCDPKEDGETHMKTVTQNCLSTKY